MFILHKRLKHIKNKLKEWNKKDFGNIFANKKSIKIKMQELNQAMIAEGFYKSKNEQAEKLNLDLKNLCNQEEIFWRQKSRIQWLREGERNTRFFQWSTIANRKHNRISSILNEDGELQTTHKDIEAVMVQHFKGITNENNQDRDHYIKEIIKNIPRMVSREDNFNLNKPVTEAK